MSTTLQHDGWDLHVGGSADGEHSVLFLAGALVTGGVYEELLSEPILRDASIRLVAATLPGFGRTTPPDDPSMDVYVQMATRLAADLGCDVVAGHSMGANVAIEMAAGSGFTGNLVLVSPSFSAQDEPGILRFMNRLTPALGYLPWAGMLKIVGSAVKGTKVSPERRAALAAEMKNNDARFCAASYRRWIEYAERYGSVVGRLCESGARAWVVFGAHGDVGLTDEERRGLEACPRVTLTTIPDAGHMTPMEAPRRIADLIVEAAAVGASAAQAA